MKCVDLAALSRCSSGSSAPETGLERVHNSTACREDSTGLQPLDDLWVLDTQAMRWEQPAVQGTKPLPRNAATMCNVDQQLVLHAGWKPFVETYNDTWVCKV